MPNARKQEDENNFLSFVGTGYFDGGYEKFHNGEMADYIPTDEDLQRGFDGAIPKIDL